jgi:hypothetical protein
VFRRPIILEDPTVGYPLSLAIRMGVPGVEVSPAHRVLGLLRYVELVTPANIECRTLSKGDFLLA